MAKSIGLEKALKKEGIIKEIFCEEKYNLGTYDYVAFDLKKLRPYDPDGFDKFMDSIGFEAHYTPKI